MSEFKRTGHYSLAHGIAIPANCKCENCGKFLKKGVAGSCVTPVGEGPNEPAPTSYFCNWNCADTKIHNSSDEPYFKAHPG